MYFFQLYMFFKLLPSPLESPLPHAGEGSVPDVRIRVLPRQREAWEKV